jgi:hypothetical protein
MQAAAAGTGQTIWLDDFFDAQQVFGQRSTVGGTRFGGALGRPILGILFGMDHRHRRFQIFQRQFELIRIAKSNPVALEEHIEQPQTSTIFARYPRILKDHEAVDLICDTLRAASMNA